MSATSFAEEMRALGHAVSEWSNGPGYTYAAHSHPYKKILYCQRGSIVFHIDDRDVSLSEGDQTIIEPEVTHAATVGPSGVQCVEAHVR